MTMAMKMWLWLLLGGTCVTLSHSNSRYATFPPVYLYEFGKFGDWQMHYVKVVYLNAHQKHAKIIIHPARCVLRPAYVRVEVINGHNPARVRLDHNVVSVTYGPRDSSAGTVLVWASRDGTPSPHCSSALPGMHQLSRHTIGKYKTNTEDNNSFGRRGRFGYHRRTGKSHHKVHSVKLGLDQAADSDEMAQDKFKEMNRNAGGSSSGEETEDIKEDNESKDSFEILKSTNNTNKYDLEDSSEESNKQSSDDEQRQKSSEHVDAVENGPVWKLKRKENTKADVNSREAKDQEESKNVTFDFNTTIFRRGNPRSTFNTEIVQEIFLPQELITNTSFVQGPVVMSKDTFVSGMSPSPGFSYQIYNFPSSAEVPAALLAKPRPLDNDNLHAYFKQLMQTGATNVTELS